jgi:hypothetical protein
MSISFVGATSAEANSVALPSHQAGDLLIVFAWRHDSTIVPSIPTGFFSAYNAATTAGGNRSGVLAYKTCDSAAEVSGTWINADMIAACVYRHATNHLAIGGVNAQVTFNGTTVTVQGLVVSTQNNNVTKLRSGEAYRFNAIGCRQNNSDINQAVAGLAQRVSLAGASAGHIVIHDSNALLNSWAGINITTDITVQASSIGVEIFDTGIAKTAGLSRPVHPFMQKVIG